MQVILRSAIRRPAIDPDKEIMDAAAWKTILRWRIANGTQHPMVLINTTSIPLELPGYPLGTQLLLYSTFSSSPDFHIHVSTLLHDNLQLCEMVALFQGGASRKVQASCRILCRERRQKGNIHPHDYPLLKWFQTAHISQKVGEIKSIEIL